MRPYPQAWLIKSGFDRETPVTHIGVVESSETQEWNEVKSGQQVLRENWNRKPGEKTGVWVFSNAPEVELFLNGRSLGRKSVVRPPDGDGAWRHGDAGPTHAVRYEVECDPADVVLRRIRMRDFLADVDFDVKGLPGLRRGGGGNDGDMLFRLPVGGLDGGCEGVVHERKC